MVCQGKAIDFKHIVFDECLGAGEYGLVNGGRIIDDHNATVFKEVSIKMLKGLSLLMIAIKAAALVTRGCRSIRIGYIKRKQTETIYVFK